MKEITTIIGQNDGPTSTILVGVHGDEVCGPLAMERILPMLSIASGTVFIILANPRAYKKNVRFTEANLNRMFLADDQLTTEEKGSYEYDRAQLIKTHLDQSSALLDIHASYTQDSKSFAICESNGRELIQTLPVDTVVSGFDACQPGGTDYYMNVTNRIGICVECGYLGDEASTERAVTSIESFLVARGHVAGAMVRRKQEYLDVYMMYVTQNENFALAENFEDFAIIKTGTVIGYDGDVPISVQEDSSILFARNVSGSGEEAFLLARQQ